MFDRSKVDERTIGEDRPETGTHVDLKSIGLDALDAVPFSVVLTDPHLPDEPVVYVNDAFVETTGYTRAQAVGRNCRFLQNGRADPATTAEIRAALAERREVTVEIDNFAADGTPFRNRLKLSPIFNGGRLRYFMGVQVRLPAAHGVVIEDAALTRAARGAELAEVHHRVKNHLSLIVSLIQQQGRRGGSGERGEFDTLAGRVKSLQLLYEDLADDSVADEEPGRVDLAAYLGRVAFAHSEFDERIRIDVAAGPLDAVSVTTATHLGLIVSELLTNALRHAFGDRPGRIVLSIAEKDCGGVRVEVVDDGAGLARGTRWPGRGTGSRIVGGLVAGLGAELDVRSGDRGTAVRIDVPAHHFDVFPSVPDHGPDHGRGDAIV